MKTSLLSAAALLLATAAFAQRYPETRGGGCSPAVCPISGHESDTLCRCGCPGGQVAALRRAAVAEATRDHLETHRRGFQQSEKPQFVFAAKDNSFSLAVGGFVSLRTAYDFEGLVDNLDFVTYDIPVPGSCASKQKLVMDASTSRIFLKAIANTRALGRVLLYFETDFRGGAPNSYTPRLRTAYVSFLGLTMGRDVTTFCDLQAAPTTVDFQGPNAYNFNFATMIRYEYSFAERRLTLGVAAEMPVPSGTFNDHFGSLPQRMPDFPLYFQYAWGAKRQSHIRASGVLRNLYYRNLSTGTASSLLGWGVQLSGHIEVVRPLDLFFNGVYGEGITPYIQDLTGAGLDFTPDPRNPYHLQTMPMWGWQAAAQINLTDRLFISGGYSTVRIQHSHGYYADDEYRRGQYVFGNIFYLLTSRCKIAGEYLYGTRENMSEAENRANRLNVMVQYSF